jgi:hypothetical protein
MTHRRMVYFAVAFGCTLLSVGAALWLAGGARAAFLLHSQDWWWSPMMLGGTGLTAWAGNWMHWLRRPAGSATGISLRRPRDQ